ncbi:MAG TPA: carbamoyltransferase HypF [Pirellulales bacterium]|nr:carbamoyltransferase HypF [Pirellulales bacterium]
MNSGSDDDQRTACRVFIRGVVQGVGFRPFVYRLAEQHGVAGWVLNGHAGVEIHAEAAPGALAAFCDALRSDPPAAASIAEFEVCQTKLEGLTGFQIRTSERNSSPTVRISPDLTVCDDCLRELSEPSDRRWQYPYINCTNCGPRYSIVRSLPYDRANTTMAAWALCPACQAEYEDPLDRRYHAQPTACGECGPRYYLLEATDSGTVPVVPALVGGPPDESPQQRGARSRTTDPVPESRATSAGAAADLGGATRSPFPTERPPRDNSETAIRRAAELLRAGAIVAIKGIGGYHLACDANQPAATAALRDRKYRKEKPFALLARELNEARRLLHLTDAHERVLLDRARPIVLAPARVELPFVAPDNAMLGVMLPYTPLHHLLFELGAPSPLVLTSANRSSEPIAYRDDDARARLSGIADAFLIGERPIARRVDDSVVAVRDGQPMLVRRARGYAPASVCRLPITRPILALGADLKNAVALAVEGEVFVSQHLGDLDDYETRLAFEETVRDLLAMYEVDAERLTIAHDLHPQFQSTQFAQTLPAAHRVAIQHHHAHIASVLAEHGALDERVIGVAFDGTGYGADGAIWGGEFLVGSIREGFERCASLRPVWLPGGDAAARFPVQCAAGYLAELDDLPEMMAPPFVFPPRFTSAQSLVGRHVRTFTSTSAGRLFDAVAALVGFTRATTFEGQAAIWLEQQALPAGPQAPYPMPDLDWRPLLAALVRDRLAGRDVCQIAAAFHAALAAATAEQIERLCSEHRLQTVALSGGVFQNDLLWSLLANRLAECRGIRLLTNSAVPVNDGGIALGQAALAAR